MTRGAGRSVEQVVRQLGRIGAQADFLSNFQTLMASGRYSHHVLQRLASILSVSDNRYRDFALYELCHLFVMLGRLGLDDARRMEFFLGAGKVRGRRIKDYLDRVMEESGETALLKQEDNHLVLLDDGREFRISYGRMSLLIAFYEFIAAMDDFSFYGEFTDLQNRLAVEGGGAVREVARTISARLRRYRQAHTVWAGYEDRFDQLATYLDRKAEAEEAEGTTGALIRRDKWVLDDDVLLSFWLGQSDRDGSRLFRTVLDLFVDLVGALRDLNGARQMETATLPEADVTNAEAMAWPEDWLSPLSAFERAPLSDVKFFVKATEFLPIQHVMELGPDGLYFPLSLLRAESFGPLQNLLVNDRRQAGVCRPTEDWAAPSYETVCETLSAVMLHVEKLQLACAAALDVLPEDDTRGVKAFKSMRRKGFGEWPQGEAVEPFREAARYLPDVAALLDRAIRRVGPVVEERDFEADRQIFFDRFTTMFEPTAVEV